VVPEGTEFDNQFHHYVLQRRLHRELELYRDGERKGIVNCPFQLWGPQSHMCFGFAEFYPYPTPSTKRELAANALYFDEIRFYDEPLFLDDQIKAMYNDGVVQKVKTAYAACTWGRDMEKAMFGSLSTDVEAELAGSEGRWNHRPTTLGGVDDDQETYYAAAYSEAGQLFLRQKTEQGLDERNAIMGMFMNPGSWSKNSLPAEGPWEWKDGFFPPFDDDGSDEEQWYSRLLEQYLVEGEQQSFSPEGTLLGYVDDYNWFPRKSTLAHKRMNDTHFEIFAYGKSLLTGAGWCRYFDERTKYEEAPAYFMNAPRDKNNPKRSGTSESRVWDYGLWGGPQLNNMLQVGPSSTDLAFPKTLGIGNTIAPEGDPVTPVFHENNPTYLNYVRSSGRLGQTDAWVGSKVEFLGKHNTHRLYQLTTDTHIRYILSGRDSRYFLVFDAVKGRETYNPTQKYLQMRLHGRGDLTADTVTQDGFPFYHWSYKAKAFGSTDVTLAEDPNVRLYVYPGLADDYLTCQVNPTEDLNYRQDSGEHDGSFEHFAVNYTNGTQWGPKHNILRMKTEVGGTAKPQRGLPVLYWPDNTGGGCGESSRG